MENSTKTIVVGVDGSPASAAALRWALEEAVREGAEVEAITAREREPAFVPATSTGFFRTARSRTGISCGTCTRWCGTSPRGWSTRRR